jgi:hypothetical protein
VSTSEILSELAKLTPAERQEVRQRLAELDGDNWLDDGLLTGAEKALIEQRLNDHVRNPGTAIPWAVAEERLKIRYGA